MARIGVVRVRPTMLWVSLLCLLVAGCSASRPSIVVTEAGVANTNVGGSFDAFKRRYDDLQRRAGTGVPIDPAEAQALVKSGTSLSYQLCSSFFKRAGTEQQILLFSRDAIGVLGTLATGVLGATNGSSAAVAALGLGTGAALSGISIYSRNFLFSEDNVQAVEHLTLSALSTAAAAALERRDYDFESAVTAIMDVQSVCEVHHILSLVRQSINVAKTEAIVTGTAAGSRIDVTVAPAGPTSGEALRVPRGTSPVTPTAAPSQQVDGVVPATVDPGSYEPLLDARQARKIQAALCLRPDAGPVRFGPATRDAIASFRSASRDSGPRNGLTLREASQLISAPACDTRVYRNAFEAFGYPNAEAIGVLQRQLARSGTPVAITGALDPQTRTAIAASQRARCQQDRSGTLTQAFVTSLQDPPPADCPQTPAVH